MAKIIYVAHEVSGDVEGNIKRILAICRRLHTKEVIPFAPYLTALQYLDDADAEERELGIRANAEFFRRGTIDEVGVFGRKVSRGIFGEFELALQYGIPIKAYNKRLATDVRYALDGLKRGIVLMKYMAAERKLQNGNTLFIRRDKSDDLVFAESQTIRDPKTSKDVTRFTPIFVYWDELFDGWHVIDKACKNKPKEEQLSLRQKVYDSLTRLYEQKTPMQRVQLDELVRN